MVFFYSVIWIILSGVFSCLCNALAKILSLQLSTENIVAFRFLFAFIFSLPFFSFSSFSLVKKNFWIHLLRSLLELLSISFNTYAIQRIDLVAASLIEVTYPLFLLLSSVVFLKEKIDLYKLILVSLCFFSLFITLFEQDVSGVAFFPIIFYSISMFLFSLQDIIVKFVLKTESESHLVFSFSSFSFAFSFYKIKFVPELWTSSIVILLIFLGICANFVRYCSSKAYKNSEIVEIAPFYYLEIITGFALGYLFFNEVPSERTISGCITVILGLWLILNVNSGSKFVLPNFS